MNIDRNLVLHIAGLARLDLTETEIETFQTQLSTILKYLDQLGEVQENAEPYVSDSRETNNLRADAIAPSLSADQALRNAPDRRDNLFRVPRILP